MKPHSMDWTTPRDFQECVPHLREMHGYCGARLVRAGLIALAFFIVGVIAFFLDAKGIALVLLLIALSYWQESGRHELLGNAIFAFGPFVMLMDASRAKDEKHRLVASVEVLL